MIEIVPAGGLPGVGYVCPAIATTYSRSMSYALLEHMVKTEQLPFVFSPQFMAGAAVDSQDFLLVPS